MTHLSLLALPCPAAASGRGEPTGHTVDGGGGLHVETNLHNNQLFCSERILLFVNF